MSRLAVLIGVGLVAAPVWAQEGIVEASGEATIRNGDKVEAKKTAIADALKNAIDKVVGVTVESSFTSEMKETVKGNQSDFQAAVADKVTKKSEGFIKTYDVLSEKAEADVFKVTVRATVFESKVRAEVEELAKLLLAAGNPKLMIVLQDVTIGPDGKQQVSPESILGTHLESELLGRGIEVRGKQAAKNVTDTVREYDRWAQETDNIAAMARKNGADILVYGRVEISDKGEITNAAFESLNGQRRVEINATVRGIVAATGQLLSAKPVQMSSMGLNLEKAVQRALKGRGNNLVNQTFDPLFVDLKAAFRKTADKGSSYVVMLKGVSNFKTQGRAFVGVLKKIPAVAGVEHKFSDGMLSVELSCKCSPQELQDQIFTAVEAEAALKALDLENVSGKQISFKL